MAGGISHGHMGIIMTQVKNAALSTSPWVEPYNSKAIPIIPPGTTAVDDAQIARMHAECRHISTNRINVDQALEKLILEAYDNMYTSQLEDYLLQYSNQSALEILMHLRHTYGFINPTQIKSPRRTFTEEITQNGQYIHSKIILLPVSAQWIQHFP
jgi:hypothetical protein